MMLAEQQGRRERELLDKDRQLFAMTLNRDQLQDELDKVNAAFAAFRADVERHVPGFALGNRNDSTADGQGELVEDASGGLYRDDELLDDDSDHQDPTDDCDHPQKQHVKGFPAKEDCDHNQGHDGSSLDDSPDDTSKLKLVTDVATATDNVPYEATH